MDGAKRKDISRTDWQREYRRQERYYAYFIKKYDAVMQKWSKGSGVYDCVKGIHGHEDSRPLRIARSLRIATLP